MLNLGISKVYESLTSSKLTMEFGCGCVYVYKPKPNNNSYWELISAVVHDHDHEYLPTPFKIDTGYLYLGNNEPLTIGSLMWFKAYRDNMGKKHGLE